MSVPDAALENKQDSLNALYEAEERAVRRNLEFEQAFAAQLKQLMRAAKQVEGELGGTAGNRQGDPTLLAGKEGKVKDWVSVRTAGEYLGVGGRQIQKLVKAGRLIRGGTAKKPLISTASLRRYFVSPREVHK